MFDNDDVWIISEKAKKISTKRFKEITGFNIIDVYYYIKNFVSENKGGRKIYTLNPELEDRLNNDEEFTQRLLNFVMDYGQSPGDFGRVSTYGEVLRNGIPSVVLVDYGLSDEVYDTHYSPIRKQKVRLYELYNFSDGNDDILSDIGGGEDIRRGMWALIPQGVGDGDEMVNENCISLVNDKNKYMSQPLSNIPILIDIYRKCVDNLKNVLNSVSNKQEFYNNLINLQ